jgi:enterochelin esterase-like enzyme
VSAPRHISDDLDVLRAAPERHTFGLGRRTALVALALAAVLGSAPIAHATPAIHSGSVQEHSIKSRHQGRTRRVWVYTPHGYTAARDTSLGMILAFDGREYLTDIPLPHLLDSLLAAGAIPPLVAILIDDASRGARLDDLANRAWFVDWIGNEVVPWVRARWRVSRDPRLSLITGSSAGGLAAVHIALRRPDLFGNSLSQSGVFWRGNEASNGPPYEWLATQAASWPRRAVRLWLEVGSTESRGALAGVAPSILSANRAMRDTLRAKGYDVTYVEVPNGVHGSETWAARLPAAIATMMGRK